MKGYKELNVCLKLIKVCYRYKMELSSRNVRFYRVKGIKSLVLKFQDKEPMNYVNNKTMGILASVLKSANKKQRLDFIFPE